MLDAISMPRHTSMEMSIDNQSLLRRLRNGRDSNTGRFFRRQAPLLRPQRPPFRHRPNPAMTPEKDPKTIAAQLCQFARTNFVAEGTDFDENSPLAQAGIDSFALVELLLFCERVIGVRVPDSHLTGANLTSMATLANCIAELARNGHSVDLNAGPAVLCLTCPVRFDWPPEIISCTARTAGCGGSACRAMSAARSSSWAAALTWNGCAGASPNRPSWTGWRARASSARCRCCRRSGGRRQNPKPILFEHHDQNGGADTPWSLPAGGRGARIARRTRAGTWRSTWCATRTAPAICYLSWNHTLLDARGSGFFVEPSERGRRDERSAHASRISSAPSKLGCGLTGWWPNAKLAHGSVKWLHESGKEPLFSLVPPGPRSGPCRNHHRLIHFTEEETARIDARCQQFNAGFRRSHFYLAASLRALHAIAVQRGNQDGAYLIPVPHDTRKRGANGPIFSNHLSILFYRIEPQHAGRISDIVGELEPADDRPDSRPLSRNPAWRRWTCSSRCRWDITSIISANRPAARFATFSFSDSGETCAGMTELWGGKILDVTHLMPCWRPPGLTVVFLRFGNRLSAHALVGG